MWETFWSWLGWNLAIDAWGFKTSAQFTLQTASPCALPCLPHRDAAHPPFPRLPAWPSRPAGVWRLACIEHAGGWNSRTTVEDMDLSLRAYIRGWGAIFLDDVTCLNEVGRGAGREGPLVC